MVRMISKTPHTYAGRNLREDDEFDCEDKDVHLLTVLGRAEVLKPEVEDHPAALIEPALIRSASTRAILKRKAP